MRTVIFSDNYPPLRNPRAFRLRNLLNHRGDHTDYLLITSRIQGFVEHDHRVVRTGLRRNPETTLRTSFKRNPVIRFFHKLCWPDDKLIHHLLYLFSYLIKYRKAEDRIYTISNPFSAHLIGFMLKIIFRHTWTADIGDIYYSEQHNSFLSKWLEKKILTGADQLIFNSSSVRDHYQTLYNLPPQKMTITANGCNLDVSKISKTESSIIRLSYIGNTYEKTREALEEMQVLITCVKRSPKIIRIQLFGQQYHKLIALQNAYPDFITISMCRNDEELIAAYSNTDMLLNFANRNNPGLPSKLEEYLASGLPVINFIHSSTDSSVQAFDWKDARVLHFDLKDGNVNAVLDFINAGLSAAIKGY